MPWQTVPSLLIIGGAFNVAAALMLGCDYLAYGKVRFHNTYSFVAGCWWVDSVRLASVLDLVACWIQRNIVSVNIVCIGVSFTLVFLVYVLVYVIVIILLASADKFLIHLMKYSRRWRKIRFQYCLLHILHYSPYIHVPDLFISFSYSWGGGLWQQ